MTAFAEGAAASPPAHEVTVQGRTRVGMKGANGFGSGITVSRDRLVVRCLGTYAFRPDEVVAFAPDGPEWLSRGVRIVHNRADVAGRLYISTRGGRQKILAALAAVGFVPTGQPFVGMRPLGTYWKVFIGMALASAFLVSRVPLPGRGSVPADQSPLPPPLTEAEAAQFARLHRSIRVSPSTCGAEEITYCDDLVRLSCGAGRDAPIYYHDNTSGEQLGECGFWVANRSCMPPKWRACAVKHGLGSLFEEPDLAQ